MKFSFSIIYRIFIFDYLWNFQFRLYMKFLFSIIYDISNKYLIILHYTLLQKKVILKLSNFYYHNQASKSTAKQFLFRLFIKFLFSIIYLIFIFDYLYNFHFRLFIIFSLKYLIKLLYTLLQKKATLKSFNFYYHNQVLKSTAKQFSFSIIYYIIIFDYL